MREKGECWGVNKPSYTSITRLLKKATNRANQLESIIKAIYTWATFDNGNPLVPKHVINLIDKYKRKQGPNHEEILK